MHIVTDLDEEDILSKLDNYKWGYYCHFIDLGHAYSYLIDCRLNVFKDDSGKWAIVGERLGYNPRAGRIMLDIFYFGNCLINLESYNGQDTNYYSVYPIDMERFSDTGYVEVLTKDARFWDIRGNKVELSHQREDYVDAGIELKEYEPGEIRLEEAGRWLIIKHQDLLRATDQELYKSIPKSLKKILVLDEWYHRDYTEISRPVVSDEHLRATYELSKKMSRGAGYMNYEDFASLFRRQEQFNSDFNQDQWLNNRPSSYETWQLLAKVIVSGDPSVYQPSLKPNTHWKNWPESGSL